jgi:hypothetical protein
MTEPKKFVKGKHQHTDWGHGVKEIRQLKEAPAAVPPQGPALEVGIDDETAKGRYANLASIGHTEGEFLLDFVFLQPGQQRAKVHTRVITSPRHAVRLCAALADNIAKYERTFGPIPADSATPPPPEGLPFQEPGRA